MTLPKVIETIEEKNVSGRIVVPTDDSETDVLLLFDIVEVGMLTVTPIRGADYPVLAAIWENDEDDIFDDDISSG